MNKLNPHTLYMRISKEMENSYFEERYFYKGRRNLFEVFYYHFDDIKKDGETKITSNIFVDVKGRNDHEIDMDIVLKEGGYEILRSNFKLVQYL